MKTKWIPVNNAALVKACKSNEPAAQKYLYEKYGPMLYGVCLRYLKERMDAEDALVETFFKIFTKMDQLHQPAVLEAWMRRIAVNESLMMLRKRKKTLPSDYHDIPEPSEEAEIQYILEEGDILVLLKELPEGYRTVFNLYVIEGYKHKEIAEMLGVSINTSKSQLIMAREKMQEILIKRFGYNPTKKSNNG